MSNLDYFIRGGIDWLLRRRSPGIYLVRAGVFLVTLIIAAWALRISFPTQFGTVSISFDSDGSTPALVAYGLGALGGGLIIVGIVWECCRYRSDQKRIARKKVIVVETRGLRDTIGNPLIDGVPNELEGHRDQVLIDLRQSIRDGVIVDPQAAVDGLYSLPVDLERREKGLDRQDITYVYGGLAPVPLTFLTGVLMDDESSITILDWDRHSGKWRALNGTDDGSRFKVSSLEIVRPATADVALAISVSYRVNLDGVRSKAGGIPLVTMELQGGSTDCHWSEEKQQVLGKQFLDTVIALTNRGVIRVHLFLAAQNSVVFRFGRLYDKRNLPEVIVYQYQREEMPPYPWGIQMPASGIIKPKVI